MNRHRTLALLASLPLAASLLVGCSGKSSPTEPTLELEPSVVAATTPPSGMVAVTEDGRGRGRGRGRGGDDGGTSGRRRGGDDRNGNGRGGRNDDNPRTGDQPRAGQEFEGAVVSVAGQTITLAGGTRVIVGAATQWSARGDLMTLQAVAGSLASGDPTRVEGRGDRQANGAILARTIKAEVDN